MDSVRLLLRLRELRCPEPDLKLGRSEAHAFTQCPGPGLRNPLPRTASRVLRVIRLEPAVTIP
eukprot:9843233-Alexandrium_andersonii.AAC.1